MELPVILQANQFALSCALGAALGVVYDFLRALRRRFARMTLPSDVLFALLVLPALLLFALYVGAGQLRLFMLAGVALGGAVYLLTVSRWVCRLFVVFFYLIIQPFALIVRQIQKFFQFFQKKWKINVAIIKKTSNIKKKKRIHAKKLRHSPPRKRVISSPQRRRTQ